MGDAQRRQSFGLPGVSPTMGVALAGDVNGPSGTNHVDSLTGPGTGIVNLTTGSFLRLDGSAGTFSAAGFIRTKAYVGTQTFWGARNSGGDSVILQQIADALIIGDSNAASGWTVHIEAYGGWLNTRGAWANYGPTFEFLSFAGASFMLLTAADLTLQMKDAAANPATPAGGAKMYSLGGALKAIGTGGTITTMAAAEPHCPVCNRDFTTEHENREKGYGYLAICLHCLADFVEKSAGPQSWIRRERA